MFRVPGGETVLWKEPGSDLPVDLEESPRESASNENAPWIYRHRWQPFLGAVLPHRHRGRQPSLWSPPSSLLASLLTNLGTSALRDASGQATRRGDSPLYQQTGWAHSRTWTLALPTRGHRCSPTHQQAGTKPRTPRTLQPETLGTSCTLQLADVSPHVPWVLALPTSKPARNQPRLPAVRPPSPGTPTAPQPARSAAPALGLAGSWPHLPAGQHQPWDTLGPFR